MCELRIFLRIVGAHSAEQFDIIDINIILIIFRRKIMEFRPCIDIHNGKVKQIVGGSLADKGDYARENFVSEADAAYFSDLYYSLGIHGGHVILLNPASSPYYNETKAQALSALSRHPGFLQIGGGINADNASEFIEAGASHVIVTSYVFCGGHIDYDRLKVLVKKVGKEHLVLDLSCKKTESGYKIVTDRWQKLTDTSVTPALLNELANYCGEYLIHAVDVEGKCNGIECELVEQLSAYEGLPVTYAGGVGSFNDLARLKVLGKSRINVTIGSALDLFGGSMALDEVLSFIMQP